MEFPFLLTPESGDEIFMAEALKEAWLAFSHGEVPVGAVVVVDGTIISRAHNRVEELQSATAHAELLAIEAASRFLDNWRLQGATLYSTLEPCSMCAGAIILSRLERVVWGAPDLRHGADGSWIELLSRPHPIHNVAAVGGLYRDTSSALMRSFFQQQRRGKGE